MVVTEDFLNRGLDKKLLWFCQKQFNDMACLFPSFVKEGVRGSSDGKNGQNRPKSKTDRYDTSYLPEAQFEPNSRGRVLKNKLGIKRKREMDEDESVALKTATDKLIDMYD